MDEVFQCAGPDCSRTLTRSGTGRPPKYCGPNCRKAAQRARDRVTETARRRLAELAEARSTAARTWRPLEETTRELEELAGAVLAYAAGNSRADLEGKLTELRETTRRLEELARAYYGATERAGQLEAEPDTTPVP